MTDLLLPRDREGRDVSIQTLVLAGTYYFPFTGVTGVKVARDGCSVVVYPADLARLQAQLEADHSTGTVDFHGIDLDESDVASIRSEMRRYGLLEATA